MAEANARVLITGATGFVGSHLVDALAAASFSLRALVRPTSRVARLADAGAERVVGALDDPATLRRALDRVDVVLHLAAATRARTEAEYLRVNADATRALVAAALNARPRPRRIVYLSSLAAAGPAVDGRPAAPGETSRPLTAYGRSKLEGEHAALEAGDDLEVVVLRAPAVYGPRDRDLFIYFRLAAYGVLPVPTGGARPVQLIHVTDLARALVLGATVPGAAGVYHVAEPRPYAWSDVARMIAAAVGRPARLLPVPQTLVRLAAAAVEGAAALTGRATIFNRDKARELLAPGWLCETDTARRELGFEACIPLDRGLAETAAWYRAHGWL